MVFLNKQSFNVTMVRVVSLRIFHLTLLTHIIPVEKSRSENNLCKY